MKPSANIFSSNMPSEGIRAALVSLLDDDDPAIYRTVRTKILSCGPEARAWLRPHILSSDPILRRHSQEILRHFERQEADTRFLVFCLKNGKVFDLEEGAWLLAQTEYPAINVEAYQALLDTYAAELRERIDFRAAGIRILTAINEYLFQELGFTGNEENYYDPENSYLNRVLDHRTGNPVSLCLLYLVLARRLRLPLAGIALPGHFICRYQSGADEIYLDAFNRGRLLTKAHCIQYLLHGSPNLQEEFLAPASPRRILARVCSNLHQIYLQLERPEEATRLQRHLIALTRTR